MSIEKFNEVLQDKVYKDWLKKVNKNIVTASTKSLRAGQQTAEKTSFYITESTVKQMYKTITGTELDSFEASLLLEEIRQPLVSKSEKTLAGTNKKISGQNAVFFENIGFETITTKLTQALSAYPEVILAYEKAEEKYLEQQTKLVTSSKEYQGLTGSKKQEKLDEIEKEAKRRATFGYYFNKGHVISIAANLAKQFRADIAKADQLAANQRKVLTDVLDKYINKLVNDDLASANLPDALTQEMYAKYTKSSDSYLVEIQIATENIEAGASSIPIVKELRNLFSGTIPEQTLLETLKSSKALGEALIISPGSPSMLSLMETELVEILTGKRSTKKTYKSPKVLVGSNSLKIVKPKKNTSKIDKLKKLKSKTTGVKSDPKKVQVLPVEEGISLTGLQNLINSKLQDVVSANMGDGDSRSVLNYRTGRLASSAKVESLSESRAGMITAFYSYMKNPYATFSDGGRQQNPRSRDPKLLIARSIREIAAEYAVTKLRAVNV